MKRLLERAVLVCPVTGEEPPPKPQDAAAEDELDPTQDKLARCWLCGKPLKVAYMVVER